MPSSSALPRQEFIERFWLGFVFFLPLVFGPGLADTFALPKVTFLRCACACLAAACLRQAVQRGQLSLTRSPLNAPLVSFLVVVFLSLLGADFRSAAFWGMGGDFSEGWTSLACYLFLFWLASSGLAAEQAEKTARVMASAAVPAALYGLLQAAGFDFFVWRDGQAVFGRPWSSLGNPNFFGAFLAMALPLAFDAVLAKPGWKQVLSASLILAVLPYTFSVAALLGAAAGLAVWLSWPGGRLRQNARRLAGVWILSGLIILGLWAWRQHRRPRGEQASPSLSAQIGAKASLSGSSFRGRWILWKTAGRMFLANPVLGVGPSSFVYQFKRWMDPEFETAVSAGLSASHAHNELVNTAASLGILGLAAYSWIAWRLLGLLLALRRQGAPAAGMAASLAAVWVNNQFSFHTVTTAAYAFILLGLLARQEAGEESLSRPFPPVPALGRGALALGYAAGFIATAASLSFLGASRFHRLAEDVYRRQGDWRRAARLGRMACRLDPFSYAYRVSLGQLLQEGILKGETFQERKTSFLDSVAEYEAVTRRAPLHSLAQNGLGVTYIHAARQLQEPSYLKEAERRFRLALAADPYFAEGISNLAGSLYLQARKPEAVEVYRQAIQGRPKAAWLHLELGDLYSQEGREEEAVLEWQRALRYDSENEAAKQRLARIWAKQEE